jgi:uncharacterized protein (TIGR02271 family)
MVHRKPADRQNETESPLGSPFTGDHHDTEVIELREEELVAQRDLRELGDVIVRTVVDDVPGRLEVDAYREEVVIDHEAVGELVGERREPWEEDGVLIVPIYEERLVLQKRLILRERIRIRRVGTTERHLLEDTLKRERLVGEDPEHTGLVHERYATDDERPRDDDDREERPGFLGGLVRKALE